MGDAASSRVSPSVRTRQDAASPIETPPFLVKTDNPAAFLAAYPDGDLPSHITEFCIELDGRNTSSIDKLLSLLPPRITLRLALPMIVRAWDREPLTAQIRHCLDRGHRHWEAANLSSLDFLPKNHANLDLTADWPLYALNPQAAATGTCPHDGRCGYTGELLRNRTGETIQVVARHCRFYTLAENPTHRPLPPNSRFIPRADFLLRPISPDALREELDALVQAGKR